MPITFTDEDFGEPKESSEITFSESDFEEQPKPEKRPVPKLTLGERLSGPLYNVLSGLEQYVVGPLAHPIKNIEATSEAIASQVAGEPRQLLVRPSEVLERPIAGAIPEIPQQPTVARQLLAGAGNTVINFANFLQTPEGLATMGIAGLPKAAQRQLTTAFAAQMATDAPQQLQGALEEAKDGNWQGVAHHLSAAGAEAFMAKQLAKPEPLTKGPSDARSIQQATEVHGDVQPQPIEGVREMPAQEGSPGVQSQTEPRLQEEVQAQGRALDDLTKKGEQPSEKAKEQEKEAVRETVEPTGAAPTAPEFTLTPAVEAEGRVFTGMNHADAIVHAARNGVDALDAEHKFLGSDGKFYNRKEAGAIFEQKTGNKPKFEEGLHSTELEQAGMLQHVKGAGEVTPAAKPPERVTPATAEGAPSAKVQPSGMAVGIAPPGTAIAQKAIAKVGRVAQGIRSLVKSSPTRKVIDQTFDAADNKANIAGQQAGKSIRIGTNKLEREAAMAIVEANGDVNKLNDFEAKVAGKDDRALVAVRYARDNWNRLQPLARRVENLLDSQIAEENTAGINTEYHEAYVPHVYDQDLMMGRGRPYVLGGAGGKGPGSGFKKGRTFDTVFDAIEQGYKPKSIDVAELVEHRVKQGNKLVNRRAWAEGLKQATDPTDGNPVVADVIRKQRGPGGTWYEAAPPGYSIKEITPGNRVAIHNGYTSLIDALTGTSRISGSLPGQALLKTAGGIKHFLLLFDTFHASRILQKELFLTGKTSFKKGHTLLEYSDQDLSRAVQANEITQEMADWTRQNRPTANLLLDSGLNVGKVQEALYSSFVRQLPIAGRFNKWVFEKVTRGAMLESGLIEFERLKKAQPNLSDKEAALKVSRDLNAYFGNLGHQGIFKSRQAQDIANLVALAPQWVESMARTEVQGAGQIAKGLTYDPAVHKSIMTGTIGKGVSQGLLAYFIGTQLLNLATRGKPTWDNQEEGHKLDAWIPDVTGKGNGFFISPFSVVAELTHDMLRYAHKEGSTLKAAARIASNKASPLWRAGKVLLSGKDYNNRTIDDTWQRVKAAGWALAPVPIPAQAPLKADYPGQLQRQLTASAGFKTEPAESPTQQMAAKAERFMKEAGKPKVKVEQAADEPSYNNLRSRLRVGDTKGAQEEIDKLLKTRTEKKVAQAMRQSVKHPFTGSAADEKKFIQGLSDEEFKLYEKAKDEKLAEYQKFLDVWRQ